MKNVLLAAFKFRQGRKVINLYTYLLVTLFTNFFLLI
jgi:hypothetical protein